MATQTHTQDAGGLTLEDVYNLLMGEIEPDLTTDKLEVVQQELELLSGEERKERIEKYSNAWNEFQKRFEAISAKRMEKLEGLEDKVKTIMKQHDADDLAAADSQLSA